MQREAQEREEAEQVRLEQIRKEQEEEKEVRTTYVSSAHLRSNSEKYLNHYASCGCAEEKHLLLPVLTGWNIFLFLPFSYIWKQVILDFGSAEVSEVSFDKSNNLIKVRPVPTYVTLHTHSQCSL